MEVEGRTLPHQVATRGAEAADASVDENNKPSTSQEGDGMLISAVAGLIGSRQRGL